MNPVRKTEWAGLPRFRGYWKHYDYCEKWKRHFARAMAKRQTDRPSSSSSFEEEQILELSQQLDETLHPSAEIKKRTSRKRTNPLPINPRLQKIPRIAADENFGYGYQPIPDEDRLAEVQNKFCLDTVSLFAKMNGGNRQRKPLEKAPEPEPRPSAAELYGEHSQRIRAMETALDIQFEFLMERRKPVRWPKKPTSGAQRF